jgi:hypothetical protein
MKAQSKTEIWPNKVQGTTFVLICSCIGNCSTFKAGYNWLARHQSRPRVKSCKHSKWNGKLYIVYLFLVLWWLVKGGRSDVPLFKKERQREKERATVPPVCRINRRNCECRTELLEAQILWQTTRVRKLSPLAYIRAKETDGRAKNVKCVLGVPYKIAVLATLQ